MIDAWVLNASPLILYARVERLDIIEQLAPGIIVPLSVLEEVKAGIHKDSTAKDAVNWASRFEMSDISVPPTVERWDLGAVGNLRSLASAYRVDDGPLSTTEWRDVVSAHMVCR